MNETDRLRAIEDIKQLKARYFRFVDTKDWQALAQVFAPDVSFNRAWAGVVHDRLTGEWKPNKPEKDEIVTGRDAVTAMVRRAVEKLYTVHSGHMPEIEVLSETTARGVWAMEDILHAPNRELLLHGRGHYHETYEKRADGWTIKSSKLTRLSLIWGPGGKMPVGYL